MDGDARDVGAKDEGMGRMACGGMRRRTRLAGGETAKKTDASPGGGASKVVKGEGKLEKRGKMLEKREENWDGKEENFSI